MSQPFSNELRARPGYIGVTVMLELGRPHRKKSDALTHIARVTHCFCNYYFYMLRSGCCMKHDVNVAVGIFHLRIRYQNHLYTYFLDVASADF